MRPSKIILGVTIGDPSGIGPEVALKALNLTSVIDSIVVVIARNSFLKKNYSSLIKNFHVVSSKDELLSNINSLDHFSHFSSFQITLVHYSSL